MVSVESSVCKVEKTKWPVSAASSAVAIVSRSRISPTRMTSGSWRRPARKAVEKFAVSTSTSDRKSIRLNSSHVEISYAVFCLKKKKKEKKHQSNKKKKKNNRQAKKNIKKI